MPPVIPFENQFCEEARYAGADREARYARAALDAEDARDICIERDANVVANNMIDSMSHVVSARNLVDARAAAALLEKSHAALRCS